MSTETRIDDLPLSGIVPSKEGSTAVLRATLAVFVGWLGVGLAEVLMTNPSLDQAAEFSTPVYYIHQMLYAAGSVEYYASIATPLLLLALLDLPRGRRLLAALAAGAAITAPFSGARDLASALEDAMIPQYGVQPDVWYYLSAFGDGMGDGVLMTVAFGLTVAIPFFLLTTAAERTTGESYTDF